MSIEVKLLIVITASIIIARTDSTSLINGAYRNVVVELQRDLPADDCSGFLLGLEVRHFEMIFMMGKDSPNILGKINYYRRSQPLIQFESLLLSIFIFCSFFNFHLSFLRNILRRRQKEQRIFSQSAVKVEVSLIAWLHCAPPIISMKTPKKRELSLHADHLQKFYRKDLISKRALYSSLAWHLLDILSSRQLL